MPLAAGACLRGAAHQAQTAAGQIVDWEGPWLSGIDRFLLLNLCLAQMLLGLKHLCFNLSTRHGAQVENQYDSIADSAGVEASSLPVKGQFDYQ